MKLPARSMASEEKPIRQWRLARRCPISPKRFWTRLGLVAACLVTVSLGLWRAGGTLGAIFLAANFVGLLIGGLMFTAHAVDGEYVSLYRDRLDVDVQNGFACCRYEFSPFLTRVEIGRGEYEGHYWLHSGKYSLPMGRELPAAARRRAVAEITFALLECHRSAAAPPGLQGASNMPAGSSAGTPIAASHA